MERGLLLLGALAGMTLGAVAHAQIALRGADSAGFTPAGITFRPAGTVAPAASGNVTPGLPADRKSVV